MPDDILYQIILGLFGALCALQLYEIRQLRIEKHRHAQQIQYALLCIAVLSKAAGVDLPPPPSAK